MTPPADGDPARFEPGRSTPHWDNLAERRLDYISQRLSELAQSLSDTAKEIRAQVRVGDQQAATLMRLEERLRDAERELDEMPKKLERQASVDWAQRLDARVANIEDENRSPFVRRLEFDPVKRAVFTLIGAICLAVLGAVAKLIMK